VKSIIFNKADIAPDHNKKTLTITLYTMSSSRDNEEVEKICNQLNNTETEFPGTDLRIIYKTATMKTTPGQEI
jgi:hypothetical protein